MLSFKRFTLFVFALLSFGAKATTEWTIQTLPDPKSSPSRTSISDPDDIIDASTESSINAITWDIEQQAGVQFGIVIVNSIGSEVPKTFASDLFNYWGIGKSGKDNGLLLVVVLDQKRWEFETGYGLEGDLTDFECKQLGTDYLVPYFKLQDFQGGIYNVTKAIRVKLFSKFGIAPGDSLELPIESESVMATSSYEEPYNDYTAPKIGKAEMTSSLLYFIIPYLLFIGIWYYAAYAWKGSSRTRDKYQARKPSLFLFFLAAFFPVAVMICFYNVESWWNHFNLFAFGSAYLAVMFLILGYRMRLNSGILKKRHHNFYKSYSDLRTTNYLWTFLLPVIFPLAGIPYLFWYYGKCKQLRRADRPCNKCSANMTFTGNVVDEVADDQYLNKGQVKEEYLKSRDWDVWLCKSCNNAEVLGYKSFYTSYSECPACKSLTEVNEGSVTVVPATYSSSGSGKTMYRCKNCGNFRETYYTIPMKTRSSSSSSGGGGGGGGGSSWGGGRSGGGGAGGSW